MKMNCGHSVNKGQSAALLVPASATMKSRTSIPDVRLFLFLDRRKQYII